MGSGGVCASGSARRAKVVDAAWDDDIDPDFDLLGDDKLDRLRNSIKRVACSYPWYRRCFNAVIKGKARNKADQPKEFARKKLYPPGGEFTRMVRCCSCRRPCPPARHTRTRDAKPQKDGSVKVTLTPWRPLCVDCYYCDLPIEVVVHVPTSPGFSTRIRDADVAAHLGATTGADGKPTGNILRRRYLVSEGPNKPATVREPFRGEDGFDYENVYEVQGKDAAAGKAA